MPIYEYRCSACGLQKDHLQKVSDPLIDTCPACGSKSYSKALSAAGFQLKGSGWYATDFKGGGSSSSASTSSGASAAAASSSTADTPAPSCGTGCACH
ncbi:zinc ribbon domain-containing protein [Uliginosibacterium sediminicola]|uniref:Zinc ribbon domain-containing protein n=1 Tax=Uliginosibacterium sediminicola TaxID=2024550 RepID=A0ABU9YZA6_9RHOO